MLLVDRYVLKNFFRYLLVALGVLVFLYVIINLFDNLGRYLGRNIPAKDIFLNYFYLTPSYITLLIPIASIIGAFFIFGHMTKNRELIALKSSGLDVNHLLLLVFLAGILISIASFAFQESVGTWAQNRLVEHRLRKIEKRPQPASEMRRNIFYSGEDDWIYYIREFRPEENTMVGVTLWKIGPRQQITKRIDAEAGRFSGIWTFSKAVVRNFDSLGNETVMSGQTVNMPELAEKPADFMKRSKPVEEMNFLEISRFVKKHRRAGEDVAKEEVELNYRFSFPLITVILLIICLPLSVVLKKGGVAIGLGISIILAFVYWGMIQSCRAYGVAGLLPPLLAAWLPNIVFSIVALAMALGIKR
jgi:lipopolysaccharide export system permease protein